MTKNYQQIGADIGLLVQTKNAAYGDSIGKSAEALTLLYPNGLRPDQYLDAILAARDFDKRSRIAQGGADDEDPRKDIAGYGLYGVACRPPTPAESYTVIAPLQVASAADVYQLLNQIGENLRQTAIKRNERGSCAQCGIPTAKLFQDTFLIAGSPCVILACGSWCAEVFKETLQALHIGGLANIEPQPDGKEPAPCHSVSASDAEPSSTTMDASASHPIAARPTTTTNESEKSERPSGGALHSASPSTFARTAAPASTAMVAVSRSLEQREKEQNGLAIRARNRNRRNHCGFCDQACPIDDRRHVPIAGLADVWVYGAACLADFVRDYTA